MRLSINCPISAHVHITMSLCGKTVLCLCLLFAVAFAGEGCDKSQCKGPIKYYEELNCKPVYAKPGDCCAVRYDCSHLEGRSPKKCYANGHEYSPGEDLKDEDRSSRCIFGCKCTEYDDRASFICPGTDCAFPPPNEACYFKHDIGCCPTQYCPKEREVVATCKVGDKTYRDGESFFPEDQPGLTCICKEGFKGEFVEPFCKKVMCDTEMRGSADIQQKCIPVHYYGQSTVTGCSISFRCQNDKDKVIKASGEVESDETSASDEQPSDMKCAFGNMTMKVGDELSQGTGYDSMCVKCICEVPPTPTCRQLGPDECQRPTFGF